MQKMELIQQNIGCCESLLGQDSRVNLLNKIVGLSDGGMRLVDRYTSTFIVEYFDRSKLESLEEVFSSPHAKMDVVQFVRFFLNAIDHADHETVYLTIALLDTFQQLTQSRPGANSVTLIDLTNYFCQHIVDQDCNIKLSLRKLPTQKISLPDLSRVRKIDKEAPVIHERASVNLPKIIKGHCKTDKTSHKSGPVEMIVYSESNSRLLTLDTLSTSIKIFDTNLNFKKELAPVQAKSSKELAIMSFAYSKKQQRIGCIVKDLGMSFWQFGDGLTTEKKILKTCGDKIYFFELFEEWVTTAGHLTHFWSIKEQSIKYSIEGDPKSHINSVCEVPMLRLVCVAYSSDKKKHIDLRKLVLYSGKKPISQLQLGRAGCHFVHYNNVAQVLIPIGYRISIPVYTIHPDYYDFTKASELVGHTSLVTCISDVGNSSLICTGDDVGFVRVWDLRMMRCTQVVKAARWLSHLLYIPSDKLIFTDSRVNMMNFEAFSPQLQIGESSEKESHVQPIAAAYDDTTKTILVATRKDVRVFDANSGRITDIYKVVTDEDIAVFTLGAGRRFLIGTDRGTVALFNKNGQCVSSFQAHHSEIFGLKTDVLNQMVITTGWDGDIGVWRQFTEGQLEAISLFKFQSGSQSKEDSKEKFGKIRSIVRSHSNWHGVQVTSVDFNAHHSLIATASSDHSVSLWDYQYCKLSARIEIPSQPTFVQLISEYPLLLVGSKCGTIWLFELRRKEFKVAVKLRLSAGIQRKEDDRGEASFLTETNKTSLNPVTSRKDVRKVQVDCHWLVPQKVLVIPNKDSTEAYFAFEGGFMGCCNLTPFISQVEKSEDSTRKQNYNPQRQCTQKIDDELSKNQYEKLDCRQGSTAVSKLQCEWLEAIHKDSIVSLELVKSPHHHILTSSSDGWFKLVHAATGEIVCAYNLNHPLPLKWNLWVSHEKKVTEKIVTALRTIGLIFKRYSHDITVNEAKVLSIKPLLDRIAGTELELKEEDQSNKWTVLAEQYTPADINSRYPRAGHKPTLKELEAYKRVYLSNVNKPNEPNQLAQNAFDSDEKNEERDAITEFLNPSCIAKFGGKADGQDDQSNPYIRNLISSFDGHRMKTQESQAATNKRVKHKQKTDLTCHARMKSYLDQNEQPKVSSILHNINCKIEEARRRHNKQSRKLDYECSVPFKRPSHSVMSNLPR